MAEVKNTEKKDEVKVALGVTVGVDELVERISASVCSKLSLEVEEKKKKETKEEKNLMNRQFSRLSKLLTTAKNTQ